MTDKKARRLAGFPVARRSVGDRERLRPWRLRRGRRQDRQGEARLVAGQGLEEGDDLADFIGAQFATRLQARITSTARA